MSYNTPFPKGLNIGCDKISYLSTNNFTKRYFSCVKLFKAGEHMNNFISNFFLGFICTLFLLILSVIITLGLKTLGWLYLERSKKTQPTQQVKKSSAANKSKPQKAPSNIVRSIEIDPEQIDKIYVKKTS